MNLRPDIYGDPPCGDAEVTPAMIAAGERVLDRAFTYACSDPDPVAFSALRDVYIAMAAASHD